MKLFGEGAESLCAVGDEDQAIYRWRGAEVEHILHFEEDFPGARVVALEANYRSTAKILAAAAGLVSHNRRRREKRLRADRGEGAAGAALAFRGGPRRDRGGRARGRLVRKAAGGDRDPLPHQRAVAALRRGARAPAHSLRRRRRHEVLRARRGQGRAGVPAAGGPPGGRPRVPARRQRAGAGDRRGHARSARRGRARDGPLVVGGLREPAGPDRARAHRARAVPRGRARPPREGRDLDAVGPPRAPALGDRLRCAVRGIRRPGGRGAPREHRGAAVLGARVRAAQRRGRDDRRVPRHGRARDRRRRGRHRAAP